MTEGRKRRGDTGLVGVLEDHLADAEYDARKAELESQYRTVMSAPDVSEHHKRVFRAVCRGPVTFNRAVEIICSAPLMKNLQKLGNDMMVASRPDPSALTYATLYEFDRVPGGGVGSG